MGLFQFGGNPEDAEARSDSDLLANFSDVLQELKRENATKDDEIGKQRREIESFTKNQESMQTVIEDLKGAVEMHKDTVSELKSANEELQRRLKDAESHRPNEIFAKLLADKNRLEVESAVENMRKDGKSVSPGAQQGGSGSSLWSWWRTVHDV